MSDTGRDAAVLESSYRHAVAVTRAAARNFGYSFWFLTPERRRAISVVYAYSRALDDCVDGVEDGLVNREQALSGLERLEGLLADSPDADEGDLDAGVDAIGPALRDTIRRFAIPREPFHELIEGMRMDLDKTRYATFEELRRYCYLAASTVGLICIEIFGHNGKAREPAIDLGIAMQLVNVLRDVPEDYRRGRNARALDSHQTP